MSACGWAVWKERQWPGQWIGQCNRLTCHSGGIRCNSEADAVAFKGQVSCLSRIEEQSIPDEVNEVQ